MSKPKKSRASVAKDGQLRIIGGSWRGRKLSFPAAEGLRPTGDRVRETLFNWLAPHVHGARCADLFTGSGALGLEALSRGAAHCDFLDTSPAAIARLREHLTTLQAGERGHCHTLSAQQFLSSASGNYDIVFIDPPFRAALVAPTCAALDVAGVLGPQSLVYIESAANEPPAEVPSHWLLHRDKSTSGVAYRLYEVS